MIDLTIKLNKDGTEGGKAKAAKPARTSGIKRLPSKRRRTSDKGWRFYDPFYYRPTLDAPFDYPPGFYKVSQLVVGDNPCDAHFEFPGNYADYVAYLNNFAKQFTKSNANHWYEITPNHPAVVAIAYLTDLSIVPLTDVAEYTTSDGWIFNPATADSISVLGFGLYLDGNISTGVAPTEVYKQTTNEFTSISFRSGGRFLLRPFYAPMTGHLSFSEGEIVRIFTYSPIYPGFPRGAVLDSSSPQYGMTVKQVFDTMPGAKLYEKVGSNITGECISGGFVSLSATDYDTSLPFLADNITGVIIQNGTRFFTAPQP